VRRAQPRRPESRAGSLLGLQSTAGNRAVSNAIAGVSRTAAPLSVQRSDTGMAAAAPTSTFTGAVLAYWRAQENKDKPLQPLGDELIRLVNSTLASLGAPPCNHSFDASADDSGAFSRTTWNIELNTAKFSERAVTKVGGLNQDEVKDIVDTIYHEARHSEQYFRIARTWAGKGKTAQEIETGMGIPATVAAAAVKAPLKGDTKANEGLIEEAGAWEAFTIGKYGKYKENVADVRDRMSTIEAKMDAYDAAHPENTWKEVRTEVAAIDKLYTDFFDKLLTDIGALPKQEKADKVVLDDLTKMKAAFGDFKTEVSKDKPDYDKAEDLRYKAYKARYDAYRNYSHEADAWETGGAAGKSFEDQAKKGAAEKAAAK
jgi:hypothetical protein